jgi:hypothetical protein
MWSPFRRAGKNAVEETASQKTAAVFATAAQGNFVLNNEGGSPTNIVNIDGFDIEDFMDNTIGMDKTTNGFAMVFLHEIQHTAILGGAKDIVKDGVKGPVVERVNVMLQELGLPERESYIPMSSGTGTHDFIPYSKEAKKKIKNGVEPTESQPHIRIHKLRAFRG